MKKMTRKLIPALAMLLISAVMMSTASFAWFTMNTEVTATGINVTAVAPKSLWIDAGDGNKLTTIPLVNQNEGASDTGRFEPATPVKKTDAAAWEFASLTNDAAKLVNAKGELGSIPGYDASSDDNAKYWKDGAANYFYNTFNLHLDGEAGSKAGITVKAKIEGTGIVSPDDDIWKAIHVAVVAADSTTPLELDMAPKSGTGATMNGDYVAFSGNLTNLTVGEAKAIHVYVWFEGGDESCYNAVAYNQKKFTIGLAFNITDPVTP